MQGICVICYNTVHPYTQIKGGTTNTSSTEGCWKEKVSFYKDPDGKDIVFDGGIFELML